MKFYLGTHQPAWLGRSPVSLFVSRRTLAPRKSWPGAVADWSLDSGGFTELQMYGRWTVSPEAYADEVRTYRDAVGRLNWAAPQDWMCEPAVIHGGKLGPLVFVGTGLSVPEHQRRTVDNYLHLREIAPDVPWIPVLQGWGIHDYVRCAGLYRAAGVDLASLPTVGVGSVCRRQDTDEIARVFRELHGMGVRCHGFGVKIQGLRKYAQHLASSDSLAWSFQARRAKIRLRGCTHSNCANCMKFAMKWRKDVLKAIDGRRQNSFF